MSKKFAFRSLLLNFFPKVAQKKCARFLHDFWTTFGKNGLHHFYISFWKKSACARGGAHTGIRVPKSSQADGSSTGIFFVTHAERNVASQHLHDPMPEHMVVRTSFAY